MYIKRVLFSFILIASNLFFSSDFFAQDSLSKIWQDELNAEVVRMKAINSYYMKQTFAKPQDVLQLTLLHEKLAKKTNKQDELCNALNQRSYAYYLMGDIKNSMVTIKQGIAVSEKLNDEVRLISFYGNLANILSAEGQHKDAINYYHKCVDIFRKVGNWEKEALALTNIGIQLTSLEGYDLALNHFEEALALYKSKHRLDATGLTLMGMSTVYFNQGKLDLAIKTGQESIKWAEKDNNFALKLETSFILAKTYHKKGDKKNARLYLDESLKLNKNLNNNSMMLNILIFDAKLSLDDDLNLATKKAESLLSKLNEDISPSVKSELYLLLYNCYKTQGKYDKSLEMFEKQKIFSDSAATQKVKLEIMRQVIQKEYQDKLLKKDVESKKVQSELTSNHRTKLIVLLFLSLFLIGYLIQYYRAKSIKEEQKREELLKEIEILRNKEEKVVGMDKNANLNKEKLEKLIDKKINETDWNVLNILLDDPAISNKDLADRAFLSVDGIGSSLRRMYEYFDIPSSKYMKIALLLKAIKISNN